MRDPADRLQLQAVNTARQLFHHAMEYREMSKKDAYVQKAKAKIDEHSAKLDQLKAQADGSIADKKIEAHKHIEKLEAKLEVAKQRLGEITDSAEEAWEDLTDRFDHLTDELGSAFKKFFNK